jgi:hypothetical protein
LFKREPVVLTIVLFSANRDHLGRDCFGVCHVFRESSLSPDLPFCPLQSDGRDAKVVMAR